MKVGDVFTNHCSGLRITYEVTKVIDDNHYECKIIKVEEIK